AAQRRLDGRPQAPWMTFVRTHSGTVPAHIAELTHISTEEIEAAPEIAEALRAFFAYVGDLPLVAHNGASYDGPLIQATCERLGLPLPPTFRVLDTLPLARTLFPCLPNHRVETLAQHLQCRRDGAHQADVDVEMLAGILVGLQQEIQTTVTGAAVHLLLS